MLKKIVLLGGCLGILSACAQLNTSQAPLATTYSTTKQQKMQAAHHWDVLAQHEARLVAASVKEWPLYIDDQKADTPFSQSFDNLLASRLLGQGVLLRNSAMGSMVLSYETQVIHHKDQDTVRKPVGFWTLLTAKIGVVAYAVDKWSSPAALLLPAAMAKDAFSGNLTDGSTTEVIITTRVEKAGSIVHSSSNIYYINNADEDHYMKPRSIRVTDKG